MILSLNNIDLEPRMSLFNDSVPCSTETIAEYLVFCERVVQEAVDKGYAKWLAYNPEPEIIRGNSERIFWCDEARHVQQNIKHAFDYRSLPTLRCYVERKKLQEE